MSHWIFGNAPLWLQWCFGGLRPTTGGGGRRWEPEPREPSSHRHSYLRLQLVQGGSGLTYVFFRWLFLFVYCLVGCFLFFLVPYFLLQRATSTLSTHPNSPRWVWFLLLCYRLLLFVSVRLLHSSIYIALIIVLIFAPWCTCCVFEVCFCFFIVFFSFLLVTTISSTYNTN